MKDISVSKEVISLVKSHLGFVSFVLIAALFANSITSYVVKLVRPIVCADT